MLGLKLIHDSKRGPRKHVHILWKVHHPVSIDLLYCVFFQYANIESGISFAFENEESVRWRTWPEDTTLTTFMSTAKNSAFTFIDTNFFYVSNMGALWYAMEALCSKGQ